MAPLLGILIVALALPAWLPILSGRAVLTRSWGAVGASTLSALLQLGFVFLVAKQILTLDYSTRFAAAGIPCCVVAIVLALRGYGRDNNRTAAALSASLGLVMWIILICLH